MRERTLPWEWMVRERTLRLLILGISSCNNLYCFCRRCNSNSLVLIEIEQVPVPGDYELGVRGDGAGQNVIVVGVLEDGWKNGDGPNDGRQRRIALDQLIDRQLCRGKLM